MYELDIEIPNEAVMGQIRLEKKGLQLVGFETQTEMGFEYQSPVFEERCLADAVFEVRAAEEIVGGDGTTWYTAGELVDTITTSGTGADWSKELPLGKYKLMEIAAPEGYALSDEVYEVDLKSIDGHTPLVTIAVKAHNEYLSAEIHLEKEKEILKPYTDADGYIRQALTATYGLGFVFGLYNADDIHYTDGMLPADSLIAVGMSRYARQTDLLRQSAARRIYHPGAGRAEGLEAQPEPLRCTDFPRKSGGRCACHPRFTGWNGA